jgi:hypothetical protein
VCVREILCDIEIVFDRMCVRESVRVSKGICA